MAVSCVTLTTPPIEARALEPMGDLAGTVSSLLYFSGFAAGSGLAAIFDALVGDRVTPFVAGFAVYGSIGFAFQVWARPEPAGSVDEAKGAVHA